MQLLFSRGVRRDRRNTKMSLCNFKHSSTTLTLLTVVYGNVHSQQIFTYRSEWLSPLLRLNFKSFDQLAVVLICDQILTTGRHKNSVLSPRQTEQPEGDERRSPGVLGRLNQHSGRIDQEDLSRVEPVGNLIKLPPPETERSEIEQPFSVKGFSTTLCYDRMETPRKSLKRSRLCKDELHTESDSDSLAEDSITRQQTKSPAKRMALWRDRVPTASPGMLEAFRGSCVGGSNVGFGKNKKKEKKEIPRSQCKAFCNAQNIANQRSFQVHLNIDCHFLFSLFFFSNPVSRRQHPTNSSLELIANS